MTDELGHVPPEKLFLALVTVDAFSNLPEIMRVIGEDKLLEFIEVFGGQTIQVPRMEAIAQAIRDVTIRERSDQGVSATVLAEQYNLSASQVRRIIASVKRAENWGAQIEVPEDA